MEIFEQASNVLKAMAHPERLKLLAALRDGPQCVCHLTALLKARQPYVSQQLAYLRDAGLVADYRDGLNIYYQICNSQVLALLDQLGAMLDQPAAFQTMRISAKLKAACPCPRCTTTETRVNRPVNFRLA